MSASVSRDSASVSVWAAGSSSELRSVNSICEFASTLLPILTHELCCALLNRFGGLGLQLLDAFPEHVVADQLLRLPELCDRGEARCLDLGILIGVENDPSRMLL